MYRKNDEKKKKNAIKLYFIHPEGPSRVYSTDENRKSIRLSRGKKPRGSDGVTHEFRTAAAAVFPIVATE